MNGKGGMMHGVRVYVNFLRCLRAFMDCTMIPRQHTMEFIFANVL